MVDIHDRDRHRRIAQHASICREKSQVSEAHVHSSHAKTYTFEVHASPSYSSCKTQILATDASLPPSSCKRHISPIKAPEVLESLVVPKDQCHL